MITLNNFDIQSFFGTSKMTAKKTWQKELIIIISRVVFVKSDDAGVDGYVWSVRKSYWHNIYNLYGLDKG